MIMSHVRKPLALAATLNTAVFAVEGVAGLKAQSLSLIMDSIHNLSDEMALVFLFLAYILPIKLSKNLQRSANLLNSVGLIAVSALLTWQGIERLQNPTRVMGVVPVIVGILAAIGNGAVAAFLWTVRDQNAAIRLAYLHNLGDIYVSLAPVLSGVLVILTGKFVFDPLVAIVIAAWIIWSTVQEVSIARDQLLWPEDAVCNHEPADVSETV
jgi:cobalt-zinc-cadmium efflux system protein